MGRINSLCCWGKFWYLKRMKKLSNVRPYRGNITEFNFLLHCTISMILPYEGGHDHRFNFQNLLPDFGFFSVLHVDIRSKSPHQNSVGIPCSLHRIRSQSIWISCIWTFIILFYFIYDLFDNVVSSWDCSLEWYDNSWIIKGIGRGLI
jgi:hypothetical protein